MNDQSKLQIAEHPEGDVSVLTLSGELTLDDGDLAFRHHVEQMIAAGVANGATFQRNDTSAPGFGRKPL